MKWKYCEKHVEINIIEIAKLTKHFKCATIVKLRLSDWRQLGRNAYGNSEVMNKFLFLNTKFRITLEEFRMKLHNIQKLMSG